MDVVFIIDYTGSMGNDFNNSSTGLKANVTSITNKVVSRSGGDYRLGLVIVDATTSSNTSALNYSDSSTYTGLAAGNKHHQVVDTTGHIHSTAIVDFEYANATDFSSKLNLLAAADNNNGNMLLGSGQGTVGWEVALNQVLNNNFAGSFRSGVQRMIIFVTDTDPEGTSTRSFNGAEETALMGTLSSQAVANVCTISIIGSISDTASIDGTTSAHTIYNGYANNTGGLTDFSADPQGIIQFIEDICDDIATGFATVVTGDGSSVSSSGFTMEGSVSNQGGSTVTARGFVRSTSNINLFIGASGVTTNTVWSGTGNFSSALTGLNSNTLYYYKAYATNTAGTSYGVGKAVTTSVGATLYAKPTTPVAYPKPVFACGQTMNTTRYYTSNTPTLGTTVYTNSSGTATLAAGNWAYDALLVEYYFTVNTFGVITSINQC